MNSLTQAESDSNRTCEGDASDRNQTVLWISPRRNTPQSAVDNLYNQRLFNRTKPASTSSVQIPSDSQRLKRAAILNTERDYIQAGSSLTPPAPLSLSTLRTSVVFRASGSHGQIYPRSKRVVPASKTHINGKT